MTVKETAEIEFLFEECYQELEREALLQGFELGSDNFSSEQDEEEIKILFNLTELEIENPNNRELFKDSVLTSELREVSAKELSGILKATEKAFDTPLISLKTLSEQDSKKISKILLKGKDKMDYIFSSQAKQVIAVSCIQRLLSFAFDVSFIFMSACALSLITVQIYFKELQSLLSFEKAEVYELFPLLSTFILSLAFCLHLYPLVCNIALQKTIGEKIFSLRLVDENLSRPAISQLVARSLLTPAAIAASCICMGLNFKRPLHDSLSKTILLQE